MFTGGAAGAAGRSTAGGCGAARCVAGGAGAGSVGTMRAWPGVGRNATAGRIPIANAISSAKAAVITMTAKTLPTSSIGLRRSRTAFKPAPAGIAAV
jgi:hypothetical protein